MNEATTNILRYSLKQVLGQCDEMTTIEKHFGDTKMDNTKSYCKSAEED